MHKEIDKTKLLFHNTRETEEVNYVLFKTRVYESLAQQ